MTLAPYQTAKPRLDPEKVTRQIEDLFREWQPLHDRMDSDFSLYELTPFVPDEREGIEEEDAFTANEHRVLADKIEAFISGSEMIIRVPDGPADMAQREANDNLERLAIGIIANANKRLHDMGQPSILAALSWYSVVRGGFVILRAFLRKDDNLQTVEDIMPVDPRHFVMEWGEKGPEWACIRTAKRRSQIRREYPDFKFDDNAEAKGEDDIEVEVVLDYYYTMPDGSYCNAVLIHKKWALAPQVLDGVTHFPVIAVPIGSMPRLSHLSADGQQEKFSVTFASFGESVFAPGRDVVAKFNRIMSYAMSQTAQGTDPPYAIKSVDGEKSFDDTPLRKGGEAKLSTANQEEIELLSTPDLRRDTQALLGAIRTEITQAYLPEQAYGILPAPISSLALRQLGNNLEQKVFPRLRAVQKAIEYALAGMVRQFESGAYAPIRVTGKTYDRLPFSGPIMPEMIEGHNELEVTLEPHFPQDEEINWRIAQLAATPTASGEPLASVDYIRSDILKIQDRDLIRNQNFETLARMSDPIAQALEMFRAATKAGDQELASRWFDKMKALGIEEMVRVNMSLIQLMQTVMMGAPPNGLAGAGGGAAGALGAGGGQNGAAPQRNPEGVSTTVAGPQANASPSPQAGTNTTSPRPGGRTDENQRLASLGLVRG